MKVRRHENSFEQKNAAILSTFYPFGSTSSLSTSTTTTTTTTLATDSTQGTTPSFTPTPLLAAMEPSELTKRLLMNWPPPPPSPPKSNEAVESTNAQEDQQLQEQQQDRNISPLSAGQASAAAQQQHQQIAGLPRSLHPTSASLIQAAAAAAASSVATSTSSSLNNIVEQEKESRRRKDFPWKLHCMLEEADTFNNQHIVSWMPDGRSFRVFLSDEFVAQIMPHYFHQTQYRSFQRMLNLYDFTKVVTGPNRGAYSHPMFIRSDRNLCLQMRIRKRNTPKKAKKPSSSQQAPGEESIRGTFSDSNRDDQSNSAVYPLFTSFQQAQQEHHQHQQSQQPNQNFAMSGVDMEGLLPMFQSQPMIQFEQHQYPQLQLQNSNQLQNQQPPLQPLRSVPLQNQSYMEQQQYQQHQQLDESPLTSRHIHTLDSNFFQGRMMNQDPSAATRTATNTPPSLGFLASAWKNAVLQRSLLSTNPSNDDQRVDLSLPSPNPMDRLIRGRNTYTMNQDESKSANLSQHDIKARPKSPGTMHQSQPAFQTPLHFDLEPTPLPPKH